MPSVIYQLRYLRNNNNQCDKGSKDEDTHTLLTISDGNFGKLYPHNNDF